MTHRKMLSTCEYVFSSFYSSKTALNTFTQALYLKYFHFIVYFYSIAISCRSWQHNIFFNLHAKHMKIAKVVALMMKQ